MEIRTKAEVYHTAKAKTFPNGKVELLVCSKPIFKESGWEDVHDKQRERREKNAASPKKEDIQRAARRAAATMRDIVLSNEFAYFVTLTLDRARVDRYDTAEITKKVNVWADNAVRRHGLKYVLVPERHQDGAVHFHGFFNECLSVVDSGTYRLQDCKKPRKPRNERQRREWEESGAQKVYNCPAWKLGFSTAIRIYGEYEAACSYALKYVHKQVECGKIGGRWFYSGGELMKPKMSLYDVDYREVEQTASYIFRVPEAGCSFCALR